MNSIPKQQLKVPEKAQFSFDDLLFVNTSAINIFMPLVFFLLIRVIPQASHLIFDQLLEQDPIFGTLAIALYSLACIVFFVSQEKNYTPNQLNSVYIRLNHFWFYIPLILWIIVLILHGIWIHKFSLVYSICFAIGIWYLIKNKLQTFRIIDSNSAFISIFISIITAFLVMFMTIYNFNKFNANKLIIISLINFTLILTFGLVVALKSNVPFSKHGFKSLRLSSLIIILGISIVLAILLHYSIPEQNVLNGIGVLLIFFLSIRLVLFGFQKVLLWIKSIKVFQAWVKYCMVVTSIILFFILFNVELNLLSNRDRFILDPVESKNHRESLKSYVVNWLGPIDTVNVDPIYLISGQGGGSRAGCVFFHTVSLLDSLINDKTLLITTASGSGTGTGFYLGLKNSLPDGTKYYEILNQSSGGLKQIDSILYRKDYISESLFKLLFTDYLTTLFGIDRRAYSRNSALLKSEKQAFEQADSILRLDNDSLLFKDWESVYQNGATTKMPIFLPNSFNIEKGLKAVSSPVVLDDRTFHPYFDIVGDLSPDSSLTIHQSILLSQLFPIISASASIRGAHYFDGGVYDNLAHETLFDVYRFVSGIRDTFSPKRPIIMLSIVNSKYEEDIKKNSIKSELGATINAATQSIFSAYPYSSKSFGLGAIHNDIDTLFDLRVFSLLKKEEPSRWKKLWQYIKYTPDNDNVILSRYLTKQNMDSIVSYSTREVNDLKYKLTKYLGK